MNKPSIPVALKRLGVNGIIRRVGTNIFALSYSIIGDDPCQPGNGQEIVEAARAKWPQAEVRWGGSQALAIIVDFGASR